MPPRYIRIGPQEAAVIMGGEEGLVAERDAVLLESDTDLTAAVLLESDTDKTAFLLLESDTG